MAEVKRLPGDGCRHHTTGRCLYQEHLNPGYSIDSRCNVLLRWEHAFDEFLERAESLNVSQDAVPDLWSRKFERMARQAFDCDNYAFLPGGPAPACVHGHDGLCRLALPSCDGRCRHYVIEKKDEES